MNPDHTSEQQPDARETPSTPPSITASIDELGERLEEKKAGDKAAPLAPETPVA